MNSEYEKAGASPATREAWLTQLAMQCLPVMSRKAGLCFGRLRVSCGFPSQGTRGRRARIGECWSPDPAEDAAAEIFISPHLAEPDEVAAALVHELIHAALPEAGHGPRFQAAARRLGLTGPFAQTRPTEAFWQWMGPLLAGLGPYPHAPLVNRTVVGAPNPQSGRLLKAACPNCGYAVRLARKWARVGAPHCPLHGAMRIEWPGPEADDGND